MHRARERERESEKEVSHLINVVSPFMLVVLTEYHLQGLKENSEIDGIRNQFPGETKEEMLRAVKPRCNRLPLVVTGMVGEKFSSLKRVSRRGKERRRFWRTVANINGRSSMVHMHVNLLLKRWTPSSGKD